MADVKTHFEEVPIELAQKAAEKEAAQPRKPEWVEIAEAVCEEKDSTKLLDLVSELNKVLDERERKPQRERMGKITGASDSASDVAS